MVFNGLLSYIRDKLDGTHFFSIAQLHQRALAYESQCTLVEKGSKPVVRHIFTGGFGYQSRVLFLVTGP
jgi:hypothetical protein